MTGCQFIKTGKCYCKSDECSYHKEKVKNMKYRIRTHYDTGVEVTVEAKDELEALEKAEKLRTNMDDKKFNHQIAENLQEGESDIVEVVKCGNKRR